MTFRSRPSDLRSQRSAVAISSKQLALHQTTEGLSVFFVVPLTAYLAFRGGQLSSSERLGLGLVALGSLVVDGYLLTRWEKL